jgi:hypothetical protein
VETAQPVQTSDVVDALTAWCPDATARRLVTTHAARWLFAAV